MQDLQNDSLENVHVLHQSVAFLMFKGAIAWLIGFAVLLILEGSSGAIQNFFSASRFQPTAFDPTQTTAALFPWQSWLYILLFVFYGWMVLQIVLSWVYDYCTIEPKNITVRKGVIFSRQDRYNMEETQSITVRQGLFGKLFNYGTIELQNPEMDKKVFLKNVPDPYHEASFIEKFYPGSNLVHVLTKHQ